MDEPLQMLLIDDNPGDVFLIRQALLEQCPCEITVFHDGDAAFEYLQRRSPDDPVPGLIVLDLNLPGRDGAEIWI